MRPVGVGSWKLGVDRSTVKPMRASRGDAARTLDAEAPDAVPARWIFSLALLGSVVLSAGISAQTYLSMLGHGHSFVAILLWQLSCWSVWALVAPLIVRAAGNLARTPRAWFRLGLIGV